MLESRRCIASHASESDYAPTSRVLLWKLGYDLVPAEDAESPDLHVVREDRLDEIPDSAREPIILLTVGRSQRPSGSRFVGRVRRPAGLHELYQLIQAALEETPRTVPRVPTSLMALATGEGQQWKVVVDSFSENGCLLSGDELPALETVVELDIELPWGERATASGVAAYEQGGKLGVVFNGITLAARKKLARVVMKLLERM